MFPSYTHKYRPTGNPLCAPLRLKAGPGITESGTGSSRNIFCTSLQLHSCCLFYTGPSRAPWRHADHFSLLKADYCCGCRRPSLACHCLLPLQPRFRKASSLVRWLCSALTKCTAGQLAGLWMNIGLLAELWELEGIFPPAACCCPLVKCHHLLKSDRGNQDRALGLPSAPNVLPARNGGTSYNSNELLHNMQCPLQ